LRKGEPVLKATGVWRRVLIAAALTAGVPAATPAAAADCANTVEQAALHTRAVQTEFMVAALACGQSEYYNAFVIKFQPQLVREGKNLQAYFRRVHGAAGTKRLNTFVTQLANLASERSIANRGRFCATARDRMNESLALQAADFPDFMYRQAALPLPGVTLCPTASAQP
jgi:hypothetical protein